jgi:tRNA pseudouridine55 synthase
MTALPTPSGLLVIDKHEGPTSMSVCRVVRARLVAGGAPKRVKVGHGGTLDPLATGLVVVLIGKATPLCDAIMAGEKRYIAEIDLSRLSTTDDREGVITELNLFRAPTREDVDRAIPSFIGTIQQRPPAHSAIWVDGTRAYHMARAGEDPNLPARPVVVHAISVLDYRFPLLKLDIRCGKGTYIRSLARDLGKALGCGGMLHSLRRTAVGPFTLDGALTLDDIPQPLLQHHLLDPARFLPAPR